MQTTNEVVAKGVVERSFEFEADGETFVVPNAGEVLFRLR